MEAFVGEWVLKSTENLDEILKKLGMNLIHRKIANTIKPSIKIEKSGDEWTFTVKTPYKNNVTKFEIGKIFDDTCMNGKSVKSLVKFVEANKMILEQRDKNDNLVLLVTREVNQNDEYVVTMKADDVICVRTHTRAN
jgi:cellular retinoic acid-binding protein 2